MADYSEQLDTHLAKGLCPWELLEPDQRQALTDFKEEKGRNWKVKLLDAWLTGRYHWDGNRIHYLQRLRNTWGPQLLKKL